VRIKLQSTDHSTLRIRLASADERARCREKAAARPMGNPAAVFLVNVDE
jgi:hypothetical protein